VSINAQKEVPMVFYSMDPENVTAWTVSQILTHVSSSFTDSAIANQGEFEAELTADEDYAIANVVVLMGGEDVTSSAYDDTTNTISISSVTGNLQIIATATASV
jgi:hypothetical protein